MIAVARSHVQGARDDRRDASVCRDATAWRGGENVLLGGWLLDRRAPRLLWRQRGRQLRGVGGDIQGGRQEDGQHCHGARALGSAGRSDAVRFSGSSFVCAHFSLILAHIWLRFGSFSVGSLQDVVLGETHTRYQSLLLSLSRYLVPVVFCCAFSETLSKILSSDVLRTVGAAFHRCYWLDVLRLPQPG